MPLIPPSIIGTVSPILADALTHSRLNDLFMAAGFPGDVPSGNKSDKVRSWLSRANKECGEPLHAAHTIAMLCWKLGGEEDGCRLT
jgi:hypothetical protein